MSKPEPKGPVPPQMWERLRQFTQQAKVLQKQTESIVASAADKDRTVEVFVGKGGQLIDVVITEKAMENYSVEELSDQILDLHLKAEASIEEQIKARTKEVYGIPFTPEQLEDGDVKVSEVVTSARREYLGR